MKDGFTSTNRSCEGLQPSNIPEHWMAQSKGTLPGAHVLSRVQDDIARDYTLGSLLDPLGILCLRRFDSCPRHPVNQGPDLLHGHGSVVAYSLLSNHAAPRRGHATTSSRAATPAVRRISHKGLLGGGGGDATTKRWPQTGGGGGGIKWSVG